MPLIRIKVSTSGGMIGPEGERYTDILVNTDFVVRALTRYGLSAVTTEIQLSTGDFVHAKCPLDSVFPAFAPGGTKPATPLPANAPSKLLYAPARMRCLGCNAEGQLYRSKPVPSLGLPALWELDGCRCPVNLVLADPLNAGAVAPGTDYQPLCREHAMFVIGCEKCDAEERALADYFRRPGLSRDHGDPLMALGPQEATTGRSYATLIEAERLVDAAITVATTYPVAVDLSALGLGAPEWNARLRPRYLAAGWGKAEYFVGGRVELSL